MLVRNPEEDVLEMDRKEEGVYLCMVKHPSDAEPNTGIGS